MKLYQIEGIPTLSQMQKEHPFTVSGIMTEKESLVALVGPNAEGQTWTSMICIKKDETETWSTRAFLWCHLDPMEAFYEKWGVSVEPPFQWEKMKQAPGHGLEWLIEEKGNSVSEALDKTLQNIGKCRMGTHLALGHLQQEANRLQASSVGFN